VLQVDYTNYPAALDFDAHNWLVYCPPCYTSDAEDTTPSNLTLTESSIGKIGSDNAGTVESGFLMKTALQRHGKVSSHTIILNYVHSMTVSPPL
jgi:hypothetical protein